MTGTGIRTDLPWLRRRTPVTAAATIEPPAAPVPPPEQPAAVSSSLDLSTPPAAPPAPAPRRATAPPPAVPVRRVKPGQSVVLTGRAPVVRLSRVQSGIGQLIIEAACSEAVGDLRLGLAYRRVDGQTSLVSHTAGAPAAHDLSSSRARFERLTVDLLGIRRLDRFLVCAYAGTEQTTLTWGGTLVVTTAGGSRVELPMDAAPSAGAVPLLSAYVVEGEIVLRAEPWEPAPTLRRACLALGYDRITWLDPWTPVA